MSRFKILAANPRRALAALATVLVAVGVTGASGANFNAASANPSNTFTAGSLGMENSKDNAAILTASNMRPGDTPTYGTVDIKNTGSLSGPFTLAKGSVSDSDSGNPMSAKLNLTVVDCGNFASGTPTCEVSDPVVYTGTIDEMGTAGHLVGPLGSFGAGEQHRYRFGVQLDGSATNAYQSDSSTVEFLWTATS
jgi:spore coat-associated protein N